MNKIETCNKLWVCWHSRPHARSNGRWYTGKHEIRFSSAESLQAHVGLVKAMAVPISWPLWTALVNLLVANTGCSEDSAEVFLVVYVNDVPGCSSTI